MGNGSIGFLLCSWMDAALWFLVCYPGWGEGVWVARGGSCFLSARGGPPLIVLHLLRTDIVAGIVA